MKQRDLVKLLKKNGWKYLRDGGNHDIYTDGVRIEAIPRHKEIKETTAKAIIKKLDLH